MKKIIFLVKSANFHNRAIARFTRDPARDSRIRVIRLQSEPPYIEWMASEVECDFKQVIGVFVVNVLIRSVALNAKEADVNIKFTRIISVKCRAVVN